MCRDAILKRLAERKKRGRPSRIPEYSIWTGIKRRCYNTKDKAYKNYGGRGIQICPEWEHDFAAFYAYVGQRPPGLTIERIDNNRGYEPGNVRWANMREQRVNQRRTKLLTINGESMTVLQWGRKNGLKKDAVWSRLRMGWDPIRAVTTPPLR